MPGRLLIIPIFLTIVFVIAFIAMRITAWSRKSEPHNQKPVRRTAQDARGALLASFGFFVVGAFFAGIFVIFSTIESKITSISSFGSRILSCIVLSAVVVSFCRIVGEERMSYLWRGLEDGVERFIDGGKTEWFASVTKHIIYIALFGAIMYLMCLGVESAVESARDYPH
jgi:hypothetical protein